MITKVSEVQITYKTKVKPSEMPKIETPQSAHNIFKSIYDYNLIEYQEMFYVMFLNKANKVLGVHLISIGSVDGTVVDVKKCFQAAILANASGIILSHNHPSGNIKPSEADKKITSQIKEAGKILNIALFDHVIVSPEDTYFSFAEEGIL
jgi:DNA repair protein RadC